MQSISGNEVRFCILLHNFSFAERVYCNEIRTSL